MGASVKPGCGMVLVMATRKVIVAAPWFTRTMSRVVS